MKTKQLITCCTLTLALSACAAYEKVDNFVGKAISNPFLLLTGGETLNHVMKWGYKNTYLSKLKGVHISELQKRGLIVSDTLAHEGLYELYGTYYGYGSGVTTNTYAVYGDGSTQLVNSHYDGGAIYFSVWLKTDKNGVIVNYKEEGNNPHVLPQGLRNKIADLLGEQPVHNKGSDTRMILVLNKTSGNWGLAVGGDNDNAGELIVKAFASCVSKDSGVPLSQLKSTIDIDKHNKNNACKLADVVPPRALALFRNELSKGYEFYGAFSQSDTIPDSEYQKEHNDCRTEGKNCRLIRTFGMKDKGKVF